MLSKVNGQDTSSASTSDLLAEIDILKSRNATLEKKLNALSYLPQIIAEKEYETRQYKEKTANYEAAHLRLHRQFASAIRSSLSPAVRCPKCGYRTGSDPNNEHSLKCNGFSQQTAEKEELLTVKLQPRGSQNIESKVKGTTTYDELQSGINAIGKLQCDGDVAFKPPVVQRQRTKSPEDVVSGLLVDFPRTKKSPESTKKPVISPVTCTTDSNDRGASGLTKPTDVKPAIDLKKDVFKAPEVSKKLFDKLVGENARMKQALRKLEEQRNVDVYNFLSCLEYERVISCLRDDLRQAQYNAEELQHFVLLQSKGNNSAISQKLVDLHQKNTQLIREKVATKQMADAYFDAYEKVKVQLNDLQAKVKDSESCDQSPAVGSSGQSPTSEDPNSAREKQLEEQVAQLQTQLSRDKQSFRFDKGVLEQKVEDLQLRIDQLTANCEDFREKNKDLAESLQSALDARVRPTINAPESLQQIALEKKKLSDENRVLRNDLKSALEEKQLLSIQLQTFNDDFQNFQADYDRKAKLVMEYKQKLEQSNLSMHNETGTRRQLEQEVKELRHLNQSLQKRRLDPKTSYVSLDEGLGSDLSSGTGSHCQQSYPSRTDSMDKNASRSSIGSRLSSGPMFPIDESRYSSIGTHHREMLRGDPSQTKIHGPARQNQGSLDSRCSLSSGMSNRSSGYYSDEAMATGGSGTSQTTKYVCSRCEEEFKVFELEQYMEHMEKCQI